MLPICELHKGFVSGRCLCLREFQNITLAMSIVSLLYQDSVKNVCSAA